MGHAIQSEAEVGHASQSEAEMGHVIQSKAEVGPVTQSEAEVGHAIQSEAEVGHAIQWGWGGCAKMAREHRDLHSCHLHFSRQLPVSVFLQTSSPTEEFHRGTYKSADVLLAKTNIQSAAHEQLKRQINWQ